MRVVSNLAIRCCGPPRVRPCCQSSAFGLRSEWVLHEGSERVQSKPGHIVDVVLREGAHAVGAALEAHAVKVQQQLQQSADPQNRPVDRRQVDLGAVPCAGCRLRAGEQSQDVFG